jgi:hypothetical protein
LGRGREKELCADQKSHATTKNIDHSHNSMHPPLFGSIDGYVVYAEDFWGLEHIARIAKSNL